MNPLDRPVVFPRKTYHQHRGDKYAHCRVTLSPQQADDPAYQRRYEEMAMRSLMHTMEEEGYCTHLDVIRTTHEMEADRLPGDYVDLTYHFPPYQPKIGQPARIDGGVGHGTVFSIPSDQWQIDVETGYQTIRAYPAGFDTATGHWVYKEDRYL